LIRIRILFLTLIRIRILFFNLIRIRIQLFDKDPDPYCYKQIMYLKRNFLCIFTWYSLSVGPIGPKQKASFIKFSLPVNFVLIRVAYRSRIRNNAFYFNHALIWGDRGKKPPPPHPPPTLRQYYRYIAGHRFRWLPYLTRTLWSTYHLCDARTCAGTQTPSRSWARWSRSPLSLRRAAQWQRR
jgi:hypothetical protein